MCQLISARETAPAYHLEPKTETLGGDSESKFNINKLPDELLREIFRLGLDSFESSDQIRLMHNSHRDWERARLRFLVDITSVCFLWRDLAISTAALWRTLSTAHTKPDDKAMQIVLQRLEIFIARANGVSLDMLLFVGLAKRVQKPVVRLLMDHINQCRSFHLISHSQGETIDFLPLPGALPLLTSLFVDVVALPRSRPLTEILTAENVAPLRNLRLHVGHTMAVIPTRMASLLEEIRTGHLRQVSLSAPEEEWAESIRFLGRCPEVCVVDVPMPVPYDRFDPPATITLPNVTTLGFGDYLPLGVDIFVRTPNLEELTIHGDSGFRHRRARLHRTLRASKDVNTSRYPLLRSVTLHDFNFVTRDLPDLRNFLGRNPAIDTITILRSEGTVMVLYALLGGHGGGSQLPPPNISEEPSSTPLFIGTTSILPMLKRLVIADSGTHGPYEFRFEHEFAQILGSVMRHWENLIVECDRRSFDFHGEAEARFRGELGARLVEVGPGWK